MIILASPTALRLAKHKRMLLDSASITNQFPRMDLSRCTTSTEKYKRKVHLYYQALLPYLSAFVKVSKKPGATNLILSNNRKMAITNALVPLEEKNFSENATKWRIPGSCDVRIYRLYA